MSEKKNITNTEFDSIDKLIENTFDRLKNILDADTIIGSTIKVSEKICIIPVNKVSVGLISGGGEIPNKKKKKNFNGCSTSGFTIIPIGFITINDTKIDYISAGYTENTPTKILDTIINIYEKTLLKNGENNV